MAFMQAFVDGNILGIKSSSTVGVPFNMYLFIYMSVIIHISLLINIMNFAAGCLDVKELVQR